MLPRNLLLALIGLFAATAAYAANPTLEKKVVDWTQAKLQLKCVEQKNLFIDESELESIEHSYDCGRYTHLVFELPKGPSYLRRIRWRAEPEQKKAAAVGPQLTPQLMTWLTQDGWECLPDHSFSASAEAAYSCDKGKSGTSEAFTINQKSSPDAGIIIEYQFFPHD